MCGYPNYRNSKGCANEKHSIINALVEISV